MEGTTVYPGLLRHIPCPAFKPKPHVMTEGKLGVSRSPDLVVLFPSVTTLNKHGSLCVTVSSLYKSTVGGRCVVLVC